MKEIWKDIVGYEGLYQVSNIGRVKSLDRIIDHKTAKKKRVKERILKTHKISSGYIGACLAKSGKKLTVSVHRLVAIAFIVNPDKKKAVNHIDSNKENNNVENLEWVTYKENMNHAIKNKLMRYDGPKGERSHKHKLKTEQVVEIKKMIKNGARVKDLAHAYKVKPTTISSIKTGRSWKHIPWPSGD